MVGFLLISLKKGTLKTHIYIYIYRLFWTAAWLRGVVQAELVAPTFRRLVVLCQTRCSNV